VWHKARADGTGCHPEMSGPGHSGHWSVST